MFKHRLLPLLTEARPPARPGEWSRFLSTDQVQLAAVIIAGLGLLVIWLWWLQSHSLI